ncbi:uncharacterized protein LOC6726154 [Drosophila simulans]|uniref:GD17292 n=1 Tax=Drosophila simulans TaxID=7240 RepID=B4R5V7_DROSI|nr:uncharacterized protein LOC6726154 [Drosophila simulans]EDX18107.1 GD17292 [Drosophila simulans]KMZ10195.1 uncharacterized protein Dsimw501_GD17292 [Drosophila simulans]
MENNNDLRGMDMGLSRADMLEQLEKRLIFLPAGKDMPLERVEDIYRNFIVPKPKRERKQRIPSPNPDFNYNSNSFEIEQLTERIKSVVIVGQKRAHGEKNSDDQAKQIKMDQD